MKKFIVILAGLLLCTSAFAQKPLAQETAGSVKVTDAKGREVVFKDLLPKGKPVIISFWDTGCKPCLQELTAIADEYDDWKESVDFEMIAVSTDDARSSSKAVPLAKGRGWPFVIVLDKNKDLGRALNVASNPTVFILDASGKVVYTHVGYTQGIEQEYFKIIRKK